MRYTIPNPVAWEAEEAAAVPAVPVDADGGVDATPSAAPEVDIARTISGWAELTLSWDAPVVMDLKAQATSPADQAH